MCLYGLLWTYLNLNVQGSEWSRFLTVLLLWSTEVGDSVAVDEIIAQIETDKVCVLLKIFTSHVYQNG
jgi:hypothetical protein